MFTMCLRFQVYFTILALLAVGTNADEPRVAVVQIANSPNVTGSITFTEAENGVHVTGRITAIELAGGVYRFHVHELGDIHTCDAPGAYFEFDFEENAPARNIRDLSKVLFNATVNELEIDYVDTVIGLRGYNSILGRAVVFHKIETVLSKAGDEVSLNGNATLSTGIACGVIGIKSPATAWSASVAIGPSTFLVFLILSILLCFKE